MPKTIKKYSGKLKKDFSYAKYNCGCRNWESKTLVSRPVANIGRWFGCKDYHHCVLVCSLFEADSDGLLSSLSEVSHSYIQ